MVEIASILEFWFGQSGTEESQYHQRRKLWFGKRPAVDQEIRTRFLDSYYQAANGLFDSWKETPCGCLALILLLDQFPRNMFRDTPQAFATDDQALAIASHTVSRGFDQSLSTLQRLFIYLPFEHSELLTAQDQAVRLMRQLVADNPDLADTMDYSLRHQEIIQRFGRFPHRNTILNRPSTPEELAFLKQPRSSF